MSTVTNFDTLHHDEWTGTLVAEVYDLDDTKNHVLDIEKPWQVEASWHLDSKEPNLDTTFGFWEITFFVESIGTKPGGYEGDVGSARLRFHEDAIPTSTPTMYAWTVKLEVPRGKINLPGIYKVTTLVQYKSPHNMPKEMAGFAEHPIVTFYEAQ
jgi:hypothetical protein